jgi:hypothetical protein
MELRREVPREDDVRVRVHVEVRVGHVVDDEPNAVGHLAAFDVGGGHGDATVRQPGSDVRALPDADLDHRTD